jgi:hypothetical protein
LLAALPTTSGIRWNEDYSDPSSDVARLDNHEPEDGVDALVSYLRRLPREAPPGARSAAAASRPRRGTSRASGSPSGTARA